MSQMDKWGPQNARDCNVGMTNILVIRKEKWVCKPEARDSGSWKQTTRRELVNDYDLSKY